MQAKNLSFYSLITLLMYITINPIFPQLSFQTLTTKNNQLIGWLPTSKKDAVLIRLKPNDSKPTIKPLNFEYIIQDTSGAYRKLPKGLFHWKRDSGKTAKTIWKGQGNVFWSKFDNNTKAARPTPDGKIFIYYNNNYVSITKSTTIWDSKKIKTPHPSEFATQAIKAPPGTFKRSDFFKNIMGENETSFIQKVKNNKQPKFSSTFAHGQFHFKSIEDLNKEIQQKKPAKKAGTLNIIEGQRTPTRGTHPMRYILDVGAAQANKDNQGAMFQLASNFHFGEARMNPEAAQKGTLEQDTHSKPFLAGGVEEIIKKAVQGEEAAISAAPGLIYKMYYEKPHNALEYYNQGGKVTDSSNNAHTIAIPVSDVGKVDYRSGLHKTHITDNAMKRSANPNKLTFPKITTQLLQDEIFLQNFIKNYKVCFLESVQVTGGLSNTDPMRERKDNFNEIVTDQQQKIHQVFSCALDLNRDRGYNINSEQTKNLAQLLLYATYEGALKAAWSIGAKKLYLTTVGTGDFKNDVEWVREAIKRLENNILASGIDVYIAIFNNQGGGSDKLITDATNIMKRIGGSHKIYDQNYTNPGDEKTTVYKPTIDSPAEKRLLEKFITQEQLKKVTKNVDEAIEKAKKTPRDLNSYLNAKKHLKEKIELIKKLLKLEKTKKLNDKLERAQDNLKAAEKQINELEKKAAKTLSSLQLALETLKKKLVKLAKKLT